MCIKGTNRTAVQIVIIEGRERKIRTFHFWKALFFLKLNNEFLVYSQVITLSERWSVSSIKLKCLIWL